MMYRFDLILATALALASTTSFATPFRNLSVQHLDCGAKFGKDPCRVEDARRCAEELKQKGDEWCSAYYLNNQKFCRKNNCEIWGTTEKKFPCLFGTYTLYHVTLF
jgi:hypothetical protein